MDERFTRKHARALVREYFNVENEDQADAILCAALRSESIFFGLRDTEKSVRAALASTKELFGHIFKA
jgi:hypothetical protein